MTFAQREIGELQICHMFVDSIVFKQKDLMFIFADGGGGWGLKTDHFFVKVLYV